MKKTILFFVIAFFLMVTSSAFAMDIGFEWDPNSESDLAGYRLYQSAISGTYNLGVGNEVMDISAGTETCTLVGVTDGQWYWVLTAYDSNGNESSVSNEVSKAVDETAPAPPTTLHFQ